MECGRIGDQKRQKKLECLVLCLKKDTRTRHARYTETRNHRLNDSVDSRPQNDNENEQGVRTAPSEKFTQDNFMESLAPSFLRFHIRHHRATKSIPSVYDLGASQPRVYNLLLPPV
jgi:hypothetical protein